MKSSKIALVALALLAAAPIGAQAQNSIRFSGTTYGCFGENCIPSLYSGIDYLNFAGATFDEVTRDDGSLPVRLGQFSWDAFYGETLLDSPFTLFIAFSNPTGIQPDPTYNGDVEGLVVRGKLNGVRTGTSTATVVFEPNVREYSFTGGDPDKAGKFTLTLYDTEIKPFTPVNISGKITDATVTPEPISMVLMGSGLAGIAAARRRRKKMAEQA